MKRLAILGLVLALWLPCGYFSRQMALYESTKEYPDQEHDSFVTSWGYGSGPMGLAYLLVSGHDFHHLRKYGLTCQERYEAFMANSAILGKKYFVSWGGNWKCNAGELKDPPNMAQAQ